MTRAQYEQHLNALFAEAYSLDEILDRFSYLAGPRTPAQEYVNNRIGSLLRRSDPLAFSIAYNYKEGLQ